jgi:hypothetical protein
MNSARIEKFKAVVAAFEKPNYVNVIMTQIDPDALAS